MALPAEVSEALARYALVRAFQNDPRRSFPAFFFRPLPMQRIALESRARTIFHGGANRTGKTLTQAANVALVANGVKGMVYEGFAKDCEPVRGWAVSKTYAQAREVVVPKLKWALGRTLAHYDESKNIMYLWNGSSISIKSEDSGFEVFQGADLDFVWKDEIGDPTIFGECKARLVDRNGVMLVSYTPTQGRDWSYSRYYRPWKDATGGKNVEHDGVLFVGTTMMENPYLPRTAIRDVEKRCMSEQERQIRIMGLYSDAAGLVFPNFSRARHVVPAFEPPAHWPRFRGMDWGQRSPAACIWVAVDPDSGKHYVYREYYQKERTIKEICDAVKAMSGLERYALTVLDPSCWNREGQKDALGRDLTKALAYQMQGIPVVKAANDIQMGINRIQGLLGRPEEEPSLFIMEGRAENLVREFMDWPWVAVARGVQFQQGNLPDKPDDKYDDHALDGCRYALVATQFMVKTDSSGFSLGDATGFEREMESLAGSVVRAVPERVELPGGSYGYRLVRRRVHDDGFDGHGFDPDGGFNT